MRESRLVQQSGGSGLGPETHSREHERLARAAGLCCVGSLSGIHTLTMGKPGRHRPYTVSEAATLLGVTPSKLRRMCDSGVLHCNRTAGGQRRIAVAVLNQFIAKRSL